MRSGQVSTLALTLRRGSVRMGRFVHSVVFGKRNLLLTNALISALMGAAGDSVQQNYDIVMSELKCDRGKVEKVEYTSTRTVHMAAAGLTTGLVSHYWYILLDRWLGIRKCPKILAAKVLLDQALFSPVNISGKQTKFCCCSLPANFFPLYFPQCTFSPWAFVNGPSGGEHETNYSRRAFRISTSLSG